MVDLEQLAEVESIINLSPKEKMERLAARIKKYYDIDMTDPVLVKNQKSEYVTKTSIGPARIILYSQCVDIKFTATVKFIDEKLTLKKSTPIIQAIFDDINKRSAIFHAVKLCTMNNRLIHFYSDTKFLIKIMVRYKENTIPSLLFRATPYSRSSFFTFMNESTLSGWKKKLELHYMKDTFAAANGFDQAFSCIREYYKGREITEEEAKRFGQLNDMVKI